MRAPQWSWLGDAQNARCVLPRFRRAAHGGPPKHGRCGHARPDPVDRCYDHSAALFAVRQVDKR
jgi:hypothetical protein